MRCLVARYDRPRAVRRGLQNEERNTHVESRAHVKSNKIHHDFHSDRGCLFVLVHLLRIFHIYEFNVSECPEFNGLAG